MALGNGGIGLDLEFGGAVTVGGTTPGAANVISANAGSGLYVNESNDLVQGNFIGTDPSGTINLGNSGDGVTVTGFGSANNTIGGTVTGAGNIIAYNGGVGVNILDPFSSGLNVGNAILSNSIFSNQHLGIDLGGDGVTPNHSGGLIAGPNGFENFPVLASAVTSSTETTIQGSLNAAASESFTIQFFADATADPSGFGQGQTYLGSITVMTDSSGNATFTANVPVVPAGYAISATATDPSGNTSEFAQDVTVAASAHPAALRAGRGNTAAIDGALARLPADAIDQTALEVLAAEVTHTRSKRSQTTT
jgi:titin